MTDLKSILDFGIAIIVGALIGLEREHHFIDKERTSFAGMRTFAMVCLTGAVCGFLAEDLGGWMIISGLVVIGAFSLASFLSIMRTCEGTVGTTTELAFAFTYLVGVVITYSSRSLGIALGIAVFALLTIKNESKKLSGRISRDDIYATLKFAIISFVILPFMPSTTFGPYHVLSLYNIWLMVVIVSAISFCGYIATTFLGGTKGMGVTALMGGLWSSTATTITFSNRTRQTPQSYGAYALGILIACSTMFPRQLLEVYIVGGSMMWAVLPALGAMGILGLGVSLIWYLRATGSEKSDIRMTNPFSLSPALKFAALYAVILVVSKAAGAHFGEGGTYLAALISGIVDVNAITLSVASLVTQDKMPMEVGARAIVIAAVANTVAKGVMTWIFGTTHLFVRVMLWFSVILALGGLVVLLPMIWH